MAYWAIFCTFSLSSHRCLHRFNNLVLIHHALHTRLSVHFHGNHYDNKFLWRNFMWFFFPFRNIFWTIDAVKWKLTLETHHIIFGLWVFFTTNTVAQINFFPSEHIFDITKEIIFSYTSQTTFWCSLILIAVGALAVISYWIKKCR